MKVFILDNSTSMVDIYIDKFEKIGIDIDLMTAKNLRIARRMISENKFDLLIMEENIDERDSGISFYKEVIRTNYPEMPVIFVSAVNEEEDINEMTNESVTMLIKPFGTRKFEDTIKMALKHS